MPKIKTHKTASKRFKISGTGKLIRRQTGISHKQTNKSSGEQRALASTKVVTRGDGQRIKRLMNI